MPVVRQPVTPSRLASRDPIERTLDALRDVCDEDPFLYAALLQYIRAGRGPLIEPSATASISASVRAHAHAMKKHGAH